MAKYCVYGLVAASVVLGEYEADSENAAIRLAEEDPDADWYPTICHQCSDVVEVGDIYETKARKA